ncbi:MAG: hypothetical protein ACYS0H_30915 [Planctomycetota bacterium]|jgi:hypothetical protein
MKKAEILHLGEFLGHLDEELDMFVYQGPSILDDLSRGGLAFKRREETPPIEIPAEAQRAIKFLIDRR